MALSYQYGYGICPYGKYGYGGFASAYAEQPFVTTDQPIIVFENLFNAAGSATPVTVGSMPQFGATDGNMLTRATYQSAVGIDYSTQNLILNSDWLSHPSWIKTNCLVAADVNVGMHKVAATAGKASYHFLTAVPINVQSGWSYILSTDVKAAEESIFVLNFGGLNTRFKAVFNLQTQTVYGNTAQYAGIVDLGNGKYRCWISAVLVGNTVGSYVMLKNAAYVGDNVSGMYFQGMQLQPGNVLQPYVGGTDVPGIYTAYNPAKNVFQLQYFPTNSQFQYAYNGGVYGMGGYGGYTPKATEIDCLIFAAARHEAAGARNVPMRVMISAETGYGQDRYGLGGYSGSLLDKILTPAEKLSNTSLILMFQRVNAVRMTLTLFGMPSVAYIPELILGNSIKMPYLELGYDTAHEVTSGQVFLAESGREYPQLRYRKMELSPRWSYLTKSDWAAVTNLIENAFNMKKIIWWAWSPKTCSTEIYQMRNNAKSTPFPMVNAQYKSLSLQLVEVL